MKYYIHGFLLLLGATGIQSIIAVVLLLLFLKRIIKEIKNKKFFISILLLLIIVFLGLSVFTREGSIRFLCACYGYPKIAYTFPADIIDIRSCEESALYIKETVYAKTLLYDFEGMPIMPMLEIYHVGPFFFSRIWRNSV